jgi:small GTP-binding protein
MTGKFAPAINTVQASCVKKMVDTGVRKVQLEIWDTAGQERYRSVGPLFFRNAVACVAVYDITDPVTLTAVEGYLQDYKNCFEAGGEIIIVANKMDLVDGDEALKDGEEYAEEHRYGFFATSAKSGAGIEELFRHIAGQLAHAGGPEPFREAEPVEEGETGGCC